jgi:hypothetical protein
MPQRRVRTRKPPPRAATATERQTNDGPYLMLEGDTHPERIGVGCGQ